MQPLLAEADGHLYVLCPFCISKQHIPIIEIETNPELHDVVRKRKRVSAHCGGNGDTLAQKEAPDEDYVRAKFAARITQSATED
jgi:hypothetical protein